MKRRSAKQFCCGLLVMLMTLSGCSTIKDFIGDEDDEGPARLPGDRMRVLGTQDEVVVDEALKTVEYRSVPAIANLSWPQRGANAANAIGALKANGFDEKDHATIGNGEEWSTILVTAPVVAENALYAMDAKGYVSRHQADDLDRIAWVSDVAADAEEDILGGGLAVAGSQLFVTTGQGDVYALNIENGSRIWARNIGSPMRSAPKLHTGVLYVSTVDDQIFALDSATGNILWQHRGLGERVGFLSAVSPAIGENLVVVAYSSGEIYGLAADTGQEVWNDSLALTRKTSATSVFTGFDGDPVIAGGVAFASSNNGITAATHLLTGRRLWEQEISAGGTPWLAGNYLFMLTSDAQVAAIYARDGRVKWVHKMPRWGNPERQLDPYRYYGPMILGEQLVVFGGDGKAVLLSPEDGMHIGTLDIPEGARTAPVVAGGTIYMVTGDAEVHALR
jgi:outer membrane protein assembly factor BamB